MSAPTFARYCCGHAMELERRYPDGNELVRCRHCDRREEIATSGYAVRPLREQVKTEATADVMAEIMAGLPAAL
jgi:hypothetical protein